MPSNALRKWDSTRTAALDEIESAHAHVGGTARGRRTATQQINQAYAVLLSSQFQGFCRDLHAESMAHLTNTVPSPALKTVLETGFSSNRFLDHGNPNEENLKKDFARFGLKFWDDVKAHHWRNDDRRKLLIKLNEWRNAIAHQSIDRAKLGRDTLPLSMVRQWRQACNGLAISFDEVMRIRLQILLAASPW